MYSNIQQVVSDAKLKYKLKVQKKINFTLKMVYLVWKTLTGLKCSEYLPDQLEIWLQDMLYWCLIDTIVSEWEQIPSSMFQHSQSFRKYGSCYTISVAMGLKLKGLTNTAKAVHILYEFNAEFIWDIGTFFKDCFCGFLTLQEETISAGLWHTTTTLMPWRKGLFFAEEESLFPHGLHFLWIHIF